MDDSSPRPERPYRFPFSLASVARQTRKRQKVLFFGNEADPWRWSDASFLPFFLSIACREAKKRREVPPSLSVFAESGKDFPFPSSFPHLPPSKAVRARKDMTP